MLMKDYEKHIADTLESVRANFKIAYCKETIVGFAFTDSEHALNSIKTNDRLIPCKKCVKAIKQLLCQ